MAADPRPHGLSQLGVCEPGAIDRNSHKERSMGKHGTRGPIAALRVISILTLIVAALLWAPTAAPAQAPAGRADAPAGRADAPAGPYTITVRFDKPFVTLGNRVTQGLFASVAYIQSKKHIEAGEDGAERQPIGTGPWKFVEHVRGDRIVYEAVQNHWRATPHFKRLVFL